MKRRGRVLVVLVVLVLAAGTVQARKAQWNSEEGCRGDVVAEVPLEVGCNRVGFVSSQVHYNSWSYSSGWNEVVRVYTDNQCQEGEKVLAESDQWVPITVNGQFKVLRDDGSYVQSKCVELMLPS